MGLMVGQYGPINPAKIRKYRYKTSIFPIFLNIGIYGFEQTTAKDSNKCYNLIHRIVIIRQLTYQFREAQNVFQKNACCADLKISQSRSYSSGDGIAVEDLKRKLASEGKKFADAVEAALTGLPVFLFRLLEIQSGLLRLRITLETLFHNNDDGKGNSSLRKEWEKTSREITEIFDLKSFADWFKCLEGQWNGKRDDKQKGKHVDISKSLKLLYVLMGESQKFPRELLAGDTWVGYNGPNWYEKAAHKEEDVRKDFATFARAVDIVLKEAQILSPHSLGQTKADSEGWQA